jgi:hypothetical protein
MFIASVVLPGERPMFKSLQTRGPNGNRMSLTSLKTLPLTPIDTFLREIPQITQKYQMVYRTLTRMTSLA